MTIYLVQGSEPVLRDREVQRLIDELLGGDDRSFALDDHTIPGRRRASDEPTESDDDTGSDGSVELPVFTAITTALQSPPFMTASRVVVVRDVGNLVSDQTKWLTEWIADPLEGVHLVLVAGGGRTPAALDKACKAAATVVGPAAEKTADVLALELKDAHVKLTGDAQKQVVAHLGEDAGRVPELVEVLHSAYGDDAQLTADDVAQYLGDLGTASRFDLTNAIDRGDVGGALEALHRLLTATSGAQSKPLHSMQVIASLEFYFQSLVRLDDPSIATKEQAAEAVKLSPGAARFRLAAAKQLGTAGLREAIQLLAQAELDLRGASGLDNEPVMEVLVARLASLSRRSKR